LSLFNLTQHADGPGGATRYEIGKTVAKRKDLESSIERICKVASSRDSYLQLHHLKPYLLQQFSPHAYAFKTLPSALVTAIIDAQEEGWTRSKSRRARVLNDIPKGEYAIFSAWRDGLDLDTLQQAKLDRQAQVEALEQQRTQAQQAPQLQNAARSVATTNRFAALDALAAERAAGAVDSASEASYDTVADDDATGEVSEVGSSTSSIEPLFEAEWEEPVTDRPLYDLLDDPDVFEFSRKERLKVLRHYAEQIVQNEAPELARLRQRLKEVNDELKALNDQTKLDVLKEAVVVGATTNAAANLLDLVAKVEPTVVLVEEAGECLEAHVVANLVPSVQMLVMIGDHLQLRSVISSYGLSIDSERGSVHRHDVSLFERLATLPIPMSLLATQRRMRPEISRLVGDFLYPELEDAPNVHEYPDVKGMSKNVGFIDHNLPEDAASQHHSSHTNQQEARWVVDLVRHLLKQGQYAPGQIAVLTPYLGQVKTLRDALAAERVTVVLDERDVGDMEAQGDDDEDISFTPQARNEQLSEVILRTIDRFQGEEAEIVILSRLYVFGNAPLLRSKAPMWESVIANLEKDDAVGPLLPARCESHGKDLGVDGPGQFAKISPTGGCLDTCGAKLPCGHACSQTCHANDPSHRFVRDPHPKCKFNVPVVDLPCGHQIKNVSCWQAADVVSIRCVEEVEKKLPCGHSVVTECSTNLSNYRCLAVCGAVLSCSHGTCKGSCSACKTLQKKGDPHGHVPHAHGKMRICGHECGKNCFDCVKAGACPPECNDWCTHCGGAVVTAVCPECGEQIGGSGHRLLDSNRNDLEMDRIAMEEGARREYLWGVRT
ncbi:hypothetical protein JCM6882_009344, partial [Rhodosporidiobolus microsporus]